MRSYFLSLAASVGLSLSPAAAQNRPGPAYFLRHPASEPHRSPGQLPGGAVVVAVAPSAGPIPTVRAAAACAPLPGTTSPPGAASAPAPRPDLTGVWASPPYGPYQHLPEAFRKHTLPAVWAEPLPLHLLRSAVGRPGAAPTSLSL
jgi:hypothetical protein